MTTPKVAALAAGQHGRVYVALLLKERYAKNASLDAGCVFGVTKKLDGKNGLSLQEYLTRKTSKQKGMRRKRPNCTGALWSRAPIPLGAY
jgi:hypothetical protein